MEERKKRRATSNVSKTNWTQGKEERRREKSGGWRIKSRLSRERKKNRRKNNRKRWLNTLGTQGGEQAQHPAVAVHGSLFQGA